jgi:predicted DNA-binding transcriptional regulator AlpA
MLSLSQTDVNRGTRGVPGLLVVASDCINESFHRRPVELACPNGGDGHNPSMDPTQSKIIELLREVHLLALKEIERLNLRIAEPESQNRQGTAREIARPVEKGLPPVNQAPIRSQSHPKLPEMMTEHEVAAFLKMSVASVRRWRLFRTGPRFVKIGSAVRYRRLDLEAWLDSCPGPE